ncbi:phage antirepressor KilAC domain-containing protein [Sporosarcina beigongshangi]|uniref:phage antirepressor KilAC domain-containing protein n=1 Tax=Sporosarcina beigongshangi TaxID=2782538 RepID=UPI0019396E50|nr:phage antirepressor KilAC domain-containing protein [Sporosarcina beigongshangi]
METRGFLTVRELAKVITRKGPKISGKELFERLHSWGLIWINGENKKLPTSQARRLRYLDVEKSSTGFDKYDREQTATVIVVTEKGQEYILERLMKELD